MQPGDISRAPLGTPDACVATGEIRPGEVLGEAGRILMGNVGMLLPASLIAVAAGLLLSGAGSLGHELIARTPLQLLLSTRQMEMAAATASGLASILTAPFIYSGPRYLVHRLLTTGEAGPADLLRGAKQYTQLALVEAIMLMPMLICDLWIAGIRDTSNPFNPAVWTALAAGSLVSVLMDAVFGPVAFEVVDRRVSAASAFRSSWRFVRGNRLRVGAISFATLALSFLGLITCGLGFVLALPFCYLAEAIVYRNLRGMTRR